MRSLCPLAVLCSFLAPSLASAQEKSAIPPSSGSDVFDFDDIDRNAKEEAKKREDAAASSLPEEVRTALAALKSFQELSAAARDEMILRNRKKLAEDLKAAAARITAADTRGSVIMEAEAIADAEASAPLPAPGRKYSAKTVKMAGQWEDPQDKDWKGIFRTDGSADDGKIKKGVWRWLDEAKGVLILDWTTEKTVHLYQVTSSSPMTVSTVSNEGKKRTKVKREGVDEKYVDAPERDALLKKAAESEKAIHVAVAKAVEGRKKQLLEDLKKRSAGAAPQLAKALGVEAAAAKEHRTESVPGAEKLAGAWKTPDKKLWQFRADGTLLVNSKPSGSWMWAKASRQNTALICLQPKSEWMLGRLSGNEKGILYINGFGEQQYELRTSP